MDGLGWHSARKTGGGDAMRWFSFFRGWWESGTCGTCGGRGRSGRGGGGFEGSQRELDGWLVDGGVSGIGGCPSASLVAMKIHPHRRLPRCLCVKNKGFGSWL